MYLELGIFVVIFPQFVMPKLPVVVMGHVPLMAVVIVFLAMIKTLHVNSVQRIFMAPLAIAVCYFFVLIHFSYIFQSSQFAKWIPHAMVIGA